MQSETASNFRQAISKMNAYAEQLLKENANALRDKENAEIYSKSVEEELKKLSDRVAEIEAGREREYTHWLAVV